ncbi:MAG: MerR family transcriptional regulator [Cyclobacteriaceae bacterium]
MGKYSIKELEKLSGIKAHTIRIWEKRHHLVTPQRTQTNIRYYSDEDLKKIINVSVLNNHGVKISKIVGLTNDQIYRQVNELSEANSSIEIYIDQLVLAMIDMEEEQFEKILSNLVLKFGFEKAVVEIVYPFLEKIGILWLTNNITPAQEHFISNLVRQKMIVAIDGLPLVPKSAQKALLFLPENELHELGLLFYHYITKKEGFRTYYLGQMVPHKDLKYVVEQHQPDLLITSLTSGPSPHAMQGYLARLSQDFTRATILVAGYALKKAKLDPLHNIITFDNAMALKDLVVNLK